MTKADIARNPLAALLAKVSGVKLQGQRRRGLTPFQMWSKEEFGTVRVDVDEEVEEECVSSQRGRVAKAQAHSMAAFKALPADEQAVWKERAREDQAAVARAKEALSGPLTPLGPVETQECVTFFLSYPVLH